MKTTNILTFIFVNLSIVVFSQQNLLELVFTAENNGTYVRLDSIKVINRTQGGDTILFWPDTVLVLDDQVGIFHHTKTGGGFQVLQNYPNPVTDQTTISMVVPDKDRVTLIITDIMGRIIMKSDRLLDEGTHHFRFTPGDGNLYFFIAQWRGISSSIKMLHLASTSSREISLQYDGSNINTGQIKAVEDFQSFFFNIGDSLLCIGFANTLESGIIDGPIDDRTYSFQFATNIPCPGTPTVEYDGQVYNTIQVFSQCWLKENLNTGVMIPGELEQSNNGTIEKYCYADNEAYCIIFGGLYRWNELMQYTTIQGVQGICPPGWHVPTEEELKVLEGAVDSQYGIGDPEWDMFDDWRGYDVCANLKTINYWPFGDGGTDLYGFSVLPAGSHFLTGFSDLGNSCYLWTSTDIGEAGPGAHGREFRAYYSDLLSLNYYKEIGLSVRCLKDDE